MLFAIYYLIKSNDDPSVAGWAALFSTVILIFALVVLCIDWMLIRYMKNNIHFWFAQITFSLLLVWIFIYLGVPGKL